MSGQGSSVYHERQFTPHPPLDARVRGHGCYTVVAAHAVTTPGKASGSTAPYYAVPIASVRGHGCYTVVTAHAVTTPAKAGVYRPLLCRAECPRSRAWLLHGGSCPRRNHPCENRGLPPLTKQRRLPAFAGMTTLGEARVRSACVIILNTRGTALPERTCHMQGEQIRLTSLANCAG